MKLPRMMQRLSLSERLEHWLLVISFTLLAITGIPQKFAGQGWAEALIQFLGGIEMVRTLHHLFGVIMILEGVYHIAAVGYKIFVRRSPLYMLPRLKDSRDFFQHLRYNLGLAQELPAFGRYTYQEKIEYWALLWGITIMAITGLFMLIPIRVTQIVPGELIPAAKAAHGWEALLAVLAIIIWHVYHVHVRQFNKSMFHGKLSEEEMREDHPLEYQRLLIGAAEPSPGEVRRRRQIYIPVAAVFVVLATIGILLLVSEQTAITTRPPLP